MPVLPLPKPTRQLAQIRWFWEGGPTSHWISKYRIIDDSTILSLHTGATTSQISAYIHYMIIIYMVHRQLSAR